MKQYNFLQDEWNGSPKTVWSRKKQNKLFRLLIKKYPTAKSLRKKLFQINTEDSVKLANYINPKWDYEQYYRFITSNVIRYSSAGKIILSQLIGAAAGMLAGYGLNKYLNISKEEFKNNLKERHNEAASIEDLAKKDAIYNSILDDVKDYQLKHNKVWRRITPYGAAIGTKGITSYSTYKLLDLLDK